MAAVEIPYLVLRLARLVNGCTLTRAVGGTAPNAPGPDAFDDLCKAFANIESEARATFFAM